MRGGGPVVREGDARLKKFSPQAWGWSGDAAFYGFMCLVLPTGMGVIRSHACVVMLCTNSLHRCKGSSVTGTADVAPGTLFSIGL